MNRRQ